MRAKRMPLIITLALSIVVIAATAAAAAAAPTAQQTVNVSAGDFFFQPATITINAGDTIVWTNTGAMAHTVTASDGSFASGLFGPGETYSQTFNTAGTIAYYCIPHGTPAGEGMAGTIVVQAVAPPAVPAPVATPAHVTPDPTPMPTPAVLPVTGEGPVTSGLLVALAMVGLALAGLGVGLARRGARG
jgi:plastocyanin